MSMSHKAMILNACTACMALAMFVLAESKFYTFGSAMIGMILGLLVVIFASNMLQRMLPIIFIAVQQLLLQFDKWILHLIVILFCTSVIVISYGRRIADRSKKERVESELRKMFCKHDSSSLPEIESLLAEYDGKEEELLLVFKQKFAESKN